MGHDTAASSAAPIGEGCDLAADKREMQRLLALAPDPDDERRRQERVTAAYAARESKPRLTADRSAFGLTDLGGGSYAKALPDGKTGHVLASESVWDESEVHDDADEPTPKAVLDRHAARVRAFDADVQARRVTRARASRRPVTRRPQGRESHSRRPRRTSSSSASSSADPPPGDGDPEPRRCYACGASIEHRRRDALTCEGSACRKAKSRGKVAPAPRIAPLDRPTQDIEEDIAAMAWQLHLSWQPDVRRGIRWELAERLRDLYAELRHARAREPLPAYDGNIASYDFDVRAAQLWRKPRRRRGGPVVAKQLEVTA